MKWLPNRAALIDFWVFDYQEFNFTDGKILLRGENGAGKSVTMQTLFPVMLDGNISATRLDPFGSRDRRMEYYVTYEGKMNDRTERISYLLLEFEIPTQNRFITLGMGLRGRKGAKSLADVWYFIVNDNRRFKHDFDVVRTRVNSDGEEEMVTLQKAELRKALTEGVTHFDDRDIYAKTVNNLLFGFPSMDVFQSWIELLLQLRMPKLASAKDMNFKAVYEILKNSMTALTDDELRVMTDSILDIDNIHDDIEASEIIFSSLQKITAAYQTYNTAVLQDKAKQYVLAHQHEQEAKVKLSEVKEEHNQLLSQLKDAQNNYTELNNELVTLNAEKTSYKDNEALGLLERHESLKEEAIRKQAQLVQNEQQFDNNRANYSRNKQQQELEESLLSDKEKEKELLEEQMNELAHNCAFLEHESFANMNKPDYKAWLQSGMGFKSELDNAIELFTTYDDKMKRLNELSDERGEFQKHTDQFQHRMNEQRESLIALQEKYMQQVMKWHNSASALELSEDEKQTMYSMASVSDEHHFTLLKQHITNIARRKQLAVNTKKAELKHKLELKTVNWTETHAELQRWKSKSDPEPVRSDRTTLFRTRLREQGILHTPLYAVIEWKNEVDLDTRRELESALQSAGLLDALIVPQLTAESITEDSILIRAERVKKEGTLLEYVNVNPSSSGLEAQEIEHYISAIAVSTNEGLTWVLPDRYYRIGAVSGHAEMTKQFFIGKTAREQLRLTNIKDLQTQLAIIDEECEKLRNERQELSRLFILIADEEISFPEPKEIISVTAIIEKYLLQIDAIAIQVELNNEQYNRVYNECAELRKKISMLTLNMDSLTLSACKNARLNMDQYTNTLHTVQNCTIKIERHDREIAIAEERMKESEELMDYFRGETNVLQSELAKLQGNLQAIAEMLKEKGIQEILERLTKIEVRLIELPEKIGEYDRCIGGLLTRLDGFNEHIIQIQNDLLKRVYRSEQAQKIFNDELQLSFHMPLDRDLLSFAKLIASQTKQNTSEAQVTLANVLAEERKVLIDYQVEVKLAFENHDGLVVERQLVDIITVSGRISPGEVESEVKEHLEALKLALTEEHQRLFEEIILNTLGQTIREKIKKTNRWIENINEIMKRRRSSVTFQLEWKGKHAQNEEQLATSELVELLMSRPELLSEEDQEKMGRHFRSQIDIARERVNEGAEEDIQTALRNVLDYREWFDFTLYCFKDGKRNEVNRTFFNVESGGEKALSVYVPLFSALHACYESAYDEAPRIVTLDEAFAGVDTKNITDMFALLEEMDMSYTLTSQALWGDYPTVKSLSISHILHPRNANYATVAQFNWNGYELTPIIEEFENEHEKQLLLEL